MPDTPTVTLRRALCGALASLCLALPLAQASVASASAVPPGAQITGQARLTVLGLQIYDATLWTGSGFSAQHYAEHSFALELHYLRNFNGNQIAQRSLKEMRALGSIHAQQARDWLAKMKQIFPDVKKGDRLLGVHHPDGKVSFSLNNKLIGEIHDKAFAPLFFGIWLSPQTSEPAMREKLIGIAAQGKPER